MSAEKPTSEIRANSRPSSDHHASAGVLVDGRYLVGPEIARGSWSVIYEATNTRTGQPVALKMLLANLPGGDEKAELRFFREARTTASLEHPNTVRVFDVGRTETGAMFIASERLKGRTLEEELDRMAASGEMMTETEALDIAAQILGSLKEAHGKGLVHRDLKPANLFVADLGGERMLKVLDFGIARILGQRITDRGVTLGSPDYMSPEQCAGQDVDARSDLYAVSAILFRLVTGRPPFVAQSEWDIIDLHRSADVPDPRALTRQPLSDAFSQLVMRGLSKHPNNRWQDAEMMLAALQDVATRLGTNVGRARRPSSVSLPKSGLHRHRESTGKWLAAGPHAPTPMTAPEEASSEASQVKTTAKYAAIDDRAIAAQQAAHPELEPTRPPGLQRQDANAEGPYRAVALGLFIVALGLAALLLSSYLR